MAMDYGLLANISPNIKRYSYTNLSQFEEIMDVESTRIQNEKDASEWTLLEVDKQTFARDFLHNPNSDNSWSAFDSTENLLLVMSMTDEHSQAMEVFGQMLTEALVPMGLNRALHSYVRKRVSGETRNKIADKGWSPSRLPLGRSKKWPSVVLEVAVSESQPKLQSDIRFWFRESQGDVKIALAFTVDRKRPHVVIEKWEYQDGWPHRTEKTTMHRGRDNRVHVNGTLTIEFEKLFLRATAAPREKDVQFSEGEMKALAEAIWEWQED